MTVAERVKLARTKRRLSQRDLAERASLSSGYLTHLERGDNEALSSKEKIGSPKLDSIERLAHALDVPVAWLAFGSGDEPVWDPDPAEGAA